ncbi:ABC transporter ATP-binding protein [Microbacterium testaceum]|uniref:ABC transporter ATP-binding protein n=1 Tax=Microbacterium testaceum TaxID=2033 RepID=UPI002AC6C2E1|nr:ATP-binding cassette domain-containing protein [Microbacterium testaceum]MDZ5143779.1 ATP-binding cassette domain-containing protein [Microbacterium testaceum]
MPDGQVLELAGLTKRFGSISAVDDLSARIEPGQVTGFLGPNGAGKTTSLRMLLGLVRPTSGTATIGGKNFSELSSPLQTVGAALEASSFHPGRSAANHLKVYARAAGLPTSRIDEVLGLVGLADVAGRRVGGFSLGMRQRLGLATALLGDPGVVVLDEPSNGLDPEGIRWMRSLLRHLAEEGRTVLISSHLLAEVQQTVDALLIISRGRLVFQGGIEDLADPDEFATVVDSPDRAALSRVLDERGIDYQLLRNGFTIRHHDPVEIGGLAAGAGIALSNLQSKGASLEDIFLELVSGVRVHESAGAVRAVESVPDAEPSTPATGLDAFPAPTGEPAPAVSHDALSAEAPTAHDDTRPSTALVAVLTPPRTLRTEAEAPEAGPRPSYAVASTGVIDIVAIAGSDGQAADRADQAAGPPASQPDGQPAEQPAAQEVQR